MKHKQEPETLSKTRGDSGDLTVPCMWCRDWVLEEKGDVNGEIGEI